MPSYASGSQLQVAYVPEVTPGTTPGSPIAKILRATSCSMGMEKNVIESAELRSDRMIADVRSGMRRIQGDIDGEFSPGTYDAFLEAMLGGTFTALRSTTGASLAMTASTRTLTRLAGSFSTDGFLANDWVFVDGFSTAGNNGLFQIQAVNATTLIFTAASATALADETTATGRTVTSWAGTLKAGATQRSFSIEVGLKNIAQYRLFKGCFPDKMNFSVKPNAITKIKMSFLGMDEVTSTSPMDAAPDPALTTKPMDGNSALASIKEGGSTIAYITGIDFTLDNQGKLLEVIGANKAAGMNWGRSKITGTVTAYIPDFTLYNKYVNETNSSLEIILGDGTVGTYSIKLPNVKYTAAKADVGNEDAIIQNLPFSALYDATTGTNILIIKT